MRNCPQKIMHFIFVISLFAIYYSRFTHYGLSHVS